MNKSLAIFWLKSTCIFMMFLASSCNVKPNYNDGVHLKNSIIHENLSLESLLDTVQKNTFKYFWDFAEPVSGMARERSQEDAFDGNTRNIVTTGGSGFGIACFPVAVNRGWISRKDALQRLDKILYFLENVETYHGVYSHWYNTETGKTKPFGGIDDGGDLVETAFLIQGLIINRQYFSENNFEESSLRNRITTIWEAVEWDWYTQDEKSLTWHWSKNHGFELDIKISGWNECLITYILASASPTHSIDKETYTNGWTRNGSMKNGETFYDITLPLGEDFGGPLFFSHYSFIGLDPRGLEDKYANYFQQNVAHTRINFEHCKRNPNKFFGYSEKSWGLTASDNNNDYSAHSPTNDLGVITPTAALSAFPYAPDESTKALKYFYERKVELWGKYGFYDAFSDKHDWVSDGYLAIDQGPIVAMIENYRTQLLWDLFMSSQEIQNGLKKLGFSSPNIQ